MQISAIENTQQNPMFLGKMNIVNDLSYLPCKYVRKAYESMTKIIADEPFDLFIKQEHKTGNLHFIAKKPEHTGKKDAPFVENIIGEASRMDEGDYTTDLYVSTARNAVNLYNNYIIPELDSSVGSRIKNFVDKLYSKLSNLTK